MTRPVRSRRLQLVGFYVAVASLGVLVGIAIVGLLP